MIDDAEIVLQRLVFKQDSFFAESAIPGGLRITPAKCIKIERPGKPQDALNTNTLAHCFYSHSKVDSYFVILFVASGFLYLSELSLGYMSPYETKSSR